MNEAIFFVSSVELPVSFSSRFAVLSACRSVPTVVSLVSTWASCLSVFRNEVRVSDATWSSWSSTVETCWTRAVWLVTVPDNAPVVEARELSPELSCGSAPELMLERALPRLSIVFCVLVLNVSESFVTLSAAAWVVWLSVLRSLRVPAAVVLASSSFLMACWYCALSLMFLSFSMSLALPSVTLCMPLTACCAEPLAVETAVETLLMLAVESFVTWAMSVEPFSNALFALEVNVLRLFCASPMAVEVWASPWPAFAAAVCTLLSAWRADCVCRGTSASFASRSLMVDRMVVMLSRVVFSSLMASFATFPALPARLPLAEFTALVSTSLTVETKVLLTVRSTVVAPWSVIFGAIGLAFSLT